MCTRPTEPRPRRDVLSSRRYRNETLQLPRRWARDVKATDTLGSFGSFNISPRRCPRRMMKLTIYMNQLTRTMVSAFSL